MLDVTKHLLYRVCPKSVRDVPTEKMVRRACKVTQRSRAKRMNGLGHLKFVIKTERIPLTYICAVALSPNRLDL